MFPHCRLPLTAAALSLLFGFSACTESDEEEEDRMEYSIPASYSEFEGVDFSGQTTRLDMLAQLGAYVKSANKKGVTLDAAKMKAMFANEGNPFSTDALNTSGKKLQDKTFEHARTGFLELFDSAAAASQDTTPGSQGKAGIVTTQSGSTYLVSGKGHEYGQLVEKGLMGALAYYQATSVYLVADEGGKLAESVPDSAKAHHWDEAFGYFTGNKNFPDTTKERFWANYAKSADDNIGCNAKIVRAFAKGRAAILNDDREAMLEAIDSVRYEWERIAAASAVRYLNAAKAAITDDGARSHQLSEGIAFVRALKYNKGKTITDAQIAEVEKHIGDDFYAVTPEGLDDAIDLLDSVFKFGEEKSKL